MACSIYGKLLFVPLLMAITMANGFKHYFKTTTTTTTTTRRPITLKVSTYSSRIVYLQALPEKYLGMGVTNREYSDEEEDDMPHIDENINFNTFSNAIIHLDCYDLELKNGDYVEVITDDSRWTYNSSFDLHANAILIKFRNPSGEGNYTCTATVERKDRGFHIDSICKCGAGEFDPEVWESPQPEGSIFGMGYFGRPVARPKRMANKYYSTLRPEHYLMSALLHKTTPFCGATVVSKNLAVTSAFCVKDRNVSDPYYILVGKNSFELHKKRHEDNLKPWRITKMISHPEYKGSYAGNIAVVRFKSPAYTGGTSFAYPACLPLNMYGNRRWHTALGWGTEDKKDPVSNILGYTLQYEVVPIKRCLDQYNITEDTTENEHSLCMTGGASFCGIDAGGPIFYSFQNSRHVYLMGIISETGFCETTGDIPQLNMHTNVTHYLDWLSTILNAENQTICVE